MTIYVGDKYYPYSVALEVTLACNMRCLHCGSYATDADRSNKLSIKDWFRVVDDLKKLKAKVLCLSGGEPFLFPHWRELVKYIKTPDDKYTEVTFISNGSSISEDDIKFMKDNKVHHIAISLDGNEQVHDYIRQHPGAFNNVLQVNQLCQEYGLKLGLVTSINKFNFDTREEILKTVLDNNIKFWQVQIVNSFGRAGEWKEKMIIEKEQYKKLIDDILRWKEIYKDQVKVFPADSIGYCHTIMDKLLDGAEWNGCSAGKHSIGIEANGNVKGCLSLQHDKFIAGNVKEKSLVDMWNDDDAFAYTRKYDSSLMEGNCKDCSEANQCKAGCLGMAFSLHNSIHENSYCYRSIVEEKNQLKRAI